MSSPCSSPLSNHRQHHQNGHIHHHHLKDGYSSLERLNRRPRVDKSSLEKLFLRRASVETMTTTLRHGERLSSEVTRICSMDNSSDEEDGFLDNTEFVRNRKERSTVLVRRFFKNNQKVHKCKIMILCWSFMTLTVFIWNLYLEQTCLGDMLTICIIFYVNLYLFSPNLENSLNINVFRTSKQSEILKYYPSFHKMTKSVCTGTRAIVRTLPSGRISEEAWEEVVCHRTWQPSKNDMWPILMRGVGEDFRVCRGMLRFVGVKLQQVRIEYTNTLLVCMSTKMCHKTRFKKQTHNANIPDFRDSAVLQRF